MFRIQAFTLPRYGKTLQAIVAKRAFVITSPKLFYGSRAAVPRQLTGPVTTANAQRIRQISADVKQAVQQRRSAASSIEERVKKIIGEQLGVKSEEVWIDSESAVHNLRSDFLLTGRQLCFLRRRPWCGQP